MKSKNFNAILLLTLVVALLSAPAVLTVSFLPVSPVSALGSYDIILTGKATAYNIDQAGDKPWHNYPLGSNPPIMVAKKVDNGAVVAAGIVPTCRTSPTPGWDYSDVPLTQYLDVLFDKSFQWMNSGATKVLWYEGPASFPVYNTAALCSGLVAALHDNHGYTVDHSTADLTSSLLSSYDILVLPQLQIPNPDNFDNSFVQAIDNFVENMGGGLFIMDGSDFGGHNYYKVHNKILQSLGFEYFFQDDQVSDPTNNWNTSDFRPIVDVGTTTGIGGAYQTAVGTLGSEIGIYSVCSMATAGPGIYLSVLPDYQVGMPGDTLKYRVKISDPYNPSAIDLTVDFSATDTNGWTKTFDNTSLLIHVTENKYTTLNVVIPANTPLDNEDTITVTAVAEGYPTTQVAFITKAHVGLRIEPTDDVYVSDQVTDANYVGENSLRIGKYNQFWQIPYLKFDLSEIPSGISPDNITSAKIYLFDYYKYSHGFDVRCCEVDDDSWLDTIVSWDTRPTPGAVLDTTYVDAADYDSAIAYSWDVTSFVKQEFAGDQTASFAMLPPDDLDNSISRAFWPTRWYESRVHPFLQIIYAAAALPPHGVSVLISPGSQSGSPGATLTYTVTVTNTGSLDDNYSLTKSDTLSWSPSLSSSTLSVAAGASGTATLTVTIPSSAASGASDTVTVTATSQTDNTISGNDTCVASVSVENVVTGVQVSISPASNSGKTGATLEFTVTVTNTGSSTDTFDLTASDTKSWGPTLSIASTTLSAGASRTGIRLSITIPSTASANDVSTITVTATSHTNSTITGNNTCRATATGGGGGGTSMLLYVGIAIVVIVIIAVVIIVLR
jgi:uncharacterized repeat protein (TIGR01451 family)